MVVYSANTGVYFGFFYLEVLDFRGHSNAAAQNGAGMSPTRDTAAAATSTRTVTAGDDGGHGDEGDDEDKADNDEDEHEEAYRLRQRR